MKQVTIHTEKITLVVLDYGAVIQKLLVKKKDGTYQNVVVGLDYPSKYPDDTISLGACVGRFAGRISGGGFTLDRQFYPLFSKNGVHIHGGQKGFGKKYWTFEAISNGKTPFVKLSYFSKHLEEGYPGNLKATVTYKLVDDILHITHEATTDRSTVINLTNHSYFSLDDADTIEHCRLQLNCPKMVETHDNLLPTGNVISVKDTPYDFLVERAIGDTQLDFPMVIEPKGPIAAKFSSEKSRISMEVGTNQPAVVVYTPRKLPAICFETQNYPDAPNHSNFPSAVLRPGETYLNASTFRFSAT